MSVLSALSDARIPARAFMAMGLYWGAFAAFVPELKAGIGAGDALFGTILAVSSVGLAVSMLLAPMFDAHAGARGMQVATGVLALAFLMPGLAGSPVFFALAMMGAALASGQMDIVMNARVSELEARHGRSLMNVSHAMFSLAYAGGAVLAGITREAGLPPVACFAGLGLIALVLMRGLVQAPEAPSGQVSGGSALLPLAVVIPGGIVVMLAFVAESATESWSALHVERTLGGRAAEGALGPAVLGLTMAAGRLFGQAVSDRVSNATVITWAALLSACGALVAAAAVAPWMAYLGFGVLGLGVSVIAPTALAMVGLRVGAGSRTRAISRVAVIGFSGFFIGPPMMGILADLFSLRVSYIAVAAMLMVVLPVLALLTRAAHRTGPTAPGAAPPP